MKRKSILLLLIFGLLATLATMYILWPVEKPVVKAVPPTREAAFLDTDPRWADSLLNILTPEERLAQLFIPELHLSTLGESDSFAFDPQLPQPGGLMFSGRDPDKQLSITRSVLEAQKVPLILMQQSLLYYSAPAQNIPDELALYAIGDTGFISGIANRAVRFAPAMGNDLLFFPDVASAHSGVTTPVLGTFLKRANQSQLLSVAGRIRTTYDLEKDSLYSRDSLLAPFQSLVDSGLTVMEADTSYFIEKAKGKQMPLLSDFCEDQLDFKGILLARFPAGQSDPTSLLRLYFKEGVELFVTGTDHFAVFSKALQMQKEGVISQPEIDRRCRKILLAKSWTRKKHFRTSDQIPEARSILHPLAKVFLRRMEEERVVLMHDRSSRFPLMIDEDHPPVIIQAGKNDAGFIREIRKYTDVKHLSASTIADLKKIKTESFRKASALVFYLDDFLLNKQDIEELKSLFSNKDLIVLHRGDPSGLATLKDVPCLVHSSGNSEATSQALANALMGSIHISGKITRNIGPWKAGYGKLLSSCRLKFSEPEEVGISNDSLFAADAIMEEAIRNRALPGGQVLFAVDGRIIYHKSFGYHTYKKEVAVEKDHLYDIASITKVAATTLMAMHFYEQKKYKLDDSLYRYLPDTLDQYLYGNSTLANVTFRELLIHASGLPAGQNIIRFMRFDEDKLPFDTYFCDERSQQFDLVTADSFYIDHDCLDTLWIDLNKIWLDPTKPYRYSDANMNLLFTLFRPMTGKIKWERYVDSLFYHPLGMHHTKFIPLQQDVKKEMIAPTEEDRYWRKQLVQGHVHDPTAALYGGVAGNAGLFSTAYDMAVLFQMFLNEGYYGGRRFLSPETVRLFTSRQNGTHRGLGFNRQIPGNTYGCSPLATEETYGHTGFTGTAVWADPVSKVIYVFISNRVHPDPENKKIIQLGTTKRVHSVVYEQLSFAGKGAGLP